MTHLIRELDARCDDLQARHPVDVAELQTATCQPFMATYVEQLLQPEGGLRCLPLFMKRYMHDQMVGRPPSGVAGYYWNRLRLLECFVEPLAEKKPVDSNFAVWCCDLAQATGPQGVVDRLSIPLTDDYGYFTWERWARTASRQGGGGELYCLANAWAQLDVRLRLPGWTAYREALTEWARREYAGPIPMLKCAECVEAEASRLVWLTAALRKQGRADLAAAAMESWLGLTATDYLTAEMLQATLRQSVLGQLCCPLTQVQLVGGLVQALRQAPERGPANVEALLHAWGQVPGAPFQNRKHPAFA